MEKITMDYIAELANVSKSTVSRALSNDSRVNEETREKILKIAEKLKYQPNKVAQALAKNNTNVIGVLIPGYPRSIADPFFLEFLQGIGEIAHQLGYSLVLPNIDQHGIENLSANKVDGVILTEPYFSDHRISYLREIDLPFVFLGNPMAGEDLCWVETDNQLAAFQAVQYLIDTGHKKIATVAGISELVAGKYRLAGYQQALEQAGLRYEPELVVFADFTQLGAYQATRKLINKTRDFTAIFAANDLMAIGVIKALKEEGIRIPYDVAVMGYDGIQFGEFIDPPLSTIKLPIKKMGRLAMDLLASLINNEEINENGILLPPELLLRGSA